MLFQLGAAATTTTGGIASATTTRAAATAIFARCYTGSSGSGSGGTGTPSPRGGGGKNRLAQGVGLVGAASVLLGKSKYLVGALKLTKLSSLGSMALTIGTYSMFFGWPYAVGMVGLIFVHETGHAIVMHQFGIPFSPAVYVPFMGAFIAMKGRPRDAWEDALVAFGGPVLGSLGAGGVAVAAHAYDSQLLYALADFGFLINLFNMLPIGSMDGGRIAGALSPYAGVAGLGLGGMLAYQGAIQNPIFYLILLAGGYETFQRFYDPHGRTPPNYYNITTAQRAAITAGYFGTVACLLAAMAANHRYQVRVAERNNWKLAIDRSRSLNSYSFLLLLFSFLFFFSARVRY